MAAQAGWSEGPPSSSMRWLGGIRAISSSHFSAGHCLVNHTEVGAMQTYGVGPAASAAASKSAAAGYRRGRSGCASVRCRISDRLRSVSCPPSPMWCGKRRLKKTDIGFLSKPTVCPAPDSAVSQPAAAKRWQHTTKSYRSRRMRRKSRHRFRYLPPDLFQISVCRTRGCPCSSPSLPLRRRKSICAVGYCRCSFSISGVASTTSPRKAVCKISIFTRQRYESAAGNPDRAAAPRQVFRPRPPLVGFKLPGEPRFFQKIRAVGAIEKKIVPGLAGNKTDRLSLHPLLKDTYMREWRNW